MKKWHALYSFLHSYEFVRGWGGGGRGGGVKVGGWGGGGGGGGWWAGGEGGKRGGRGWGAEPSTFQVEFYIWEAIKLLFSGSLLVALSSWHNSPVSMWTGFSPWTSKFSDLIWLARWERSDLPVEGFLRTSCLAWDFARQTACLARRLAFCYSSLLPPFFQVFQHLCFTLTALSIAGIPPPGLFSPPVFLGARPTHIFSCLQQTGLQPSPDLFFSTATSTAWGRLRDESLLVLWLSLWHPEAPGP